MTGFETHSYDNPDVLAPQIRARYEYLEVRSACAIMRAVSPDEWQDITEFSQVALRGTTTIHGYGNALLSHYPYAGCMNDEPRYGLSTNATSNRFQPIAIPDDAHSLLLHGHTHATIPDEFNDPRQINIGLDAWELKPVNETSIISLLVNNGEYAKRTGWETQIFYKKYA